MNTYAFHEEGALLIDEDVAAAILLRSDLDDPPEGLTDEIRAIAEAEGCYAAVTAHRNLFDPAYLEDLHDIQCAMEALEPYGIDCGFASGFEGEAKTLEEAKPAVPERSWSFDDDFMAVVPAGTACSLFAAAYANPEELAAEFAGKLGPVLGDRFPYLSYIVNIFGTYYC